MEIATTINKKKKIRMYEKEKNHDKEETLQQKKSKRRKKRKKEKKETKRQDRKRVDSHESHAEAPGPEREQQK